MTAGRKSLLIGTAFVACYFVFIVVVFRVIYSLGHDPRAFEYLQWPITFPLALPPIEFWDFLQRRGFTGKSWLVTAAYLLVDVALYSLLAYAALLSWVRINKPRETKLNTF